jgi:hypothetical protein
MLRLLPPSPLVPRGGRGLWGARLTRGVKSRAHQGHILWWQCVCGAAAPLGSPFCFCQSPVPPPLLEDRSIEIESTRIDLDHHPSHTHTYTPQHTPNHAHTETMRRGGCQQQRRAGSGLALAVGAALAVLLGVCVRLAGANVMGIDLGSEFMKVCGDELKAPVELIEPGLCSRSVPSVPSSLPPSSLHACASGAGSGSSAPSD